LYLQVSKSTKLDPNLIESSPLNENLKKILVMREVEGKTNAEVASQLGKDPSTVSGQYTNAKRKIAEWQDSLGPVALSEREEGREQAAVFALLDKGVPLTQVTIQTGLSGEKVTKHTDVYVRLIEKQKEFAGKIAIETKPASESEAPTPLAKLRKYFAFVEMVGGFKAHNCRFVGKDHYCSFWSWPSEPTELSRSPKRVGKGEYHIVASSLMCAPCHAFVSKAPRAKG